MAVMTASERGTRRPRRSALRCALVGACLAATVTAGAGAAAQAADRSPATSVSTACGSPLSDAEVDSILMLSDISTLSAGDPLGRFDQEVERNRQITAILVRHRDRRGLFAVGLDAMERETMEPLLHTTGFADPAFGHAFTPELLSLFLTSLHDDFEGRPTAAHWARFYDLAHQCSASPVQVAMAGYNAHLTVDVGKGLAAVHARLGDLRDYLTIDSAIVGTSQLIISRTKAAYGVGLSGIWPLMTAASPVIYTAAFINGLALQIPPASPVVHAEIAVLWESTDTAIALATT